MAETAAASAPEAHIEESDGDARNSMGFQITSITASRADAAAADADADADEWADGGDESVDEDASVVTEAASTSSGGGGGATLALLTTPAESATGVLPAIPTADGFGITLVPGAVPVVSGGEASALVQLPSASEMDLITGSPPSSAAAAAAAAAGNPGSPGSASDWQSRFKVVRIETNVPFKCGRWQCMDYHDQPKADGEKDSVPELIPAEEALRAAEWHAATAAASPPADPPLELRRRASDPPPPPPPADLPPEAPVAAQQGRTMPDLLPSCSLLNLVRGATGDYTPDER
ncbi:Protein bunched, class 2/F/G isoform [Amphibalanus amphitrite]|uniref:Protein bunched, class 2/F/G isoform n=1 Tax=Amphibalanus amphitrite TaxID=1232801 RepID=A0A6A4V820_AMPAM|nr:Protein bunched, class 2/F/G isoform [Amphibalanus amphitrite]